MEIVDNKSSEYASIYKRDYDVHGDDNNNEEYVEKVQKAVQTANPPKKQSANEVKER